MTNDDNRSPFAPPTPPSPSTQPVTFGGPPADVIPTDVVAAPPSKRRPVGRIVGAGVAVVALVAAGVFAFTKIGGSSTKGGASSSTDAGEKFVASLNNEDILGVVDLLLPGERDTFRQPMLDAVDNFKRLGILSSDADPSKVAGLDIKLDDVKVAADRPVADDIDTVRISATDNTTYDGRKLPIGDLLLREAFGGKQPDKAGSSNGEPFKATIATVERDGRWYISLFYSAAEAARGDGADVPAKPVALAGADGPEAAVDQMVRSIAALDLTTIIGGLNPNEAEALQRYAPLFLDDAQRQLDDQKANIKVTKATYDVKGSGDHRLVGVTALSATAKLGDQSASFEFADGCVAVTSGKDNEKVCAGDASVLTNRVGDNPKVKALLDAVTSAFADAQGTGIAVDQVDGKWYVSLIGTGADAFNGLLRALDKNELADIIDKAKALASSTDVKVNIPDLGGVLNTP